VHISLEKHLTTKAFKQQIANEDEMVIMKAESMFVQTFTN